MLAGGALTTLGGCGVFNANTYRFRMTVEVDTPQGVRSGSSVYEVRAWNTPKILPEGRARDWSLRGEAVAVDLSGGQTLFALMTTRRYDLLIVSMRTLDPAFRNDIVESAARIANGAGIRSPAEINRSDYPWLVSFRDNRDPASVVPVDPEELYLRLGAGVSLRRILVAVTDDRVTALIRRRLPWIVTHRGTLKPNPPRLMNDPSDPDLQLLDAGPFTTERFS